MIRQTEQAAVQTPMEKEKKVGEEGTRGEGSADLSYKCVKHDAPPLPLVQKCLCVVPWRRLVCWRKLMSLWARLSKEKPASDRRIRK